jgi:hypothetical protein
VNGAFGGATQPVVSFSSDPPLSTVDIFSLLLGETEAFATGQAELRSLSAAGVVQSEQELLKAAGARLLGGALSAPVGRVVEQTLGLDTVQITPIFGGGESDPLSPSARSSSASGSRTAPMSRSRARSATWCVTRASCSNTIRASGSAGC